MDTIIPCAGQSTRFPNMRPKYLLNDYLGRSMLQLAADPYLKDHNVHAVILKDHDKEFQSAAQIKRMFNNKVNVITLAEPTSGPAETIDKALDILRLGSEGFLARDCDCILEHSQLSPGNKIFVDTLINHPTLRIPSNKSYLTTNNWDIVTNIIEKKIISDIFCVGGYQFESASEYRNAFSNLKNSKLTEIYLSSVIDYMIATNKIFKSEQVKSFIDLGTLEDWAQYNNKPTLFVDIDGTLVENQSQYGKNNYKVEAVALTNNASVLLDAKQKGAQIIFTTSRPKEFESETRALLDKLGFEGCQLLMGMHHAKRILINDFTASNSYPSAIAINIPRNSDTLRDYLKL